MRWADPEDPYDNPYGPPGEDPGIPPPPDEPPPQPDPVPPGPEGPVVINNPPSLNPTPGGGGPGQFTGTFMPPQMQPYPNLGEIPLPPLPQLPERPTPPPFAFDDYTGPPSWSYQDFQHEAFKAPSVEEALQDPSFLFRKQQGEQSLQGWAAARGTLNDSGTAKALIDYGQNAATQEYSNVWNRGLQGYQTNFNNALMGYTTNRGNSLEAFNTNERHRADTYDRNRGLAVDKYNTNYRTQYEDPYRAAYTAAIDTWIPKQEGWRANVENSRLGYTTQAGQAQRNNEMNYSNAWQRFMGSYDRWKDERDTGILLAGG